jgi:hypothetical protein
MATAQTNGAKPDYIGLLNTISLAESAAGVYLEAWANSTQDEELAGALRLVALREAQHGDAFCRRLSELGFPLQQKADPEAGARVAKYANPKISDCEKIGPERAPEANARDPFAEIEQAIADGKYDPMTANMMKWYITEERDSGRRLKPHYDRIRAAMAASQPAMANGKANGAAASMGPGDDAQAIMACMTDGFSRLEKSIEKLARALK